MASNLESFLIKTNKVRNEKTISAELKNGQSVELDIKEITAQELKRIRSRNTKTYPPAEGTSMATTNLDDMGFATDIAIAGITAPDLRSAKLFNHFGVSTVEDLLYEMFTINEIGKISTEIIQLTNANPSNKPTTNGIEPELKREAKNS